MQKLKCFLISLFGFIILFGLNTCEKSVSLSITQEPEDLTLDPGQSAVFTVKAIGSEPITFQWLRDGQVIAGATKSSYSIVEVTRSDSGARFSVIVKNPAGELASRESILNVNRGLVFGISGFRAIFPDGPNDLTAIRFKVKILKNESQSLRLIFCFNRLHNPGTSKNYILESNIYSGTYHSYPHNGCTNWPLLGEYIENQASLRIAIPDYAFHFGQQPGITTGIISHQPELYPVQTYLIDNIPNLYKSDAISQLNHNGLESIITLERGEIINDVTSFSRCSYSLEQGVYRKWHLIVETSGSEVTLIDFVVPEQYAKYLTVNEAMNFLSEFIHGYGIFTVQYWNFCYKRESNDFYVNVSNFITSNRYDGNGRDFGVRVITFENSKRIEFSNEKGLIYLPRNTTFSLF